MKKENFSTAVTNKLPVIEINKQEEFKRPISRFLFGIVCVLMIPLLALYMWVRHPLLCLKQAKKTLNEDFGRS